ncbi:hypothetical protein M378DRAFT_291223 [Amanita muscaria Koide BX008]|uniref:Uncharacterized protein n=1 Tax=Amanita muscaria (strain Koide BX008) TaxID=946122 RepID=A0A0C2WQ46_AMAMK|nr:hypothetical protein M378DRAFT_291223 [Amanita muscaria Koide BX008]
MDWNHQKIPYDSSIFNTVCRLKTSKSSDTIDAPGAENVGQAQIVSQFSQPLTPEGLFGVADAGAFSETTADVQRRTMIRFIQPKKQCRKMGKNDIRRPCASYTA